MCVKNNFLIQFHLQFDIICSKLEIMVLYVNFELFFKYLNEDIIIFATFKAQLKHKIYLNKLDDYDFGFD